MGCQKGKKEVKKNEDGFECKKCGATTEKKSKVCKPKKLKADKKDKKK